MEKPASYESLLERFPDKSERIKQLLKSDTTFEEICSDYEQLSLWLTAHSHEDCTPDSECAANRQLLTELEVEILQVMQAVDRQPGG